jgi:hypothetical protein
VNIEAWAGSVHVEVLKERVKRVPCEANSSAKGVVGRS